MVAAGPTELTPIRPKTGQDKYLAAAIMIVCAYNIMVVDSLLLCLKQRSDLQYWEQSMLASAALVGAFGGATAFGICGDTCGRHKSFLWSAVVMLFGCTASACCYAPTTRFLVQQLSICRFVVGFGAGGLYPLIASIVTENVPKAHAPVVVAVTFSMHGIGFLLSSVVPLVLFAAQVHAEIIWRLSVAAGAVPVVFILYMWWYLNPLVANAAMLPQQEDAFIAYSITEIVSNHCASLAGTTSTWFLSSIVYYGLACFRSQIVKGFVAPHEIGPLNDAQSFQAISCSAMFAIATIPGFVLMIACIDRVGVRTLQAGGFALMALTCFFVADFAGRAQPVLLTAVLSLAFFFSCVGPNSTTYILPAVYYPISHRSTCHGISGAAGKLGAIAGGAAFPLWNEAFGIQGILYMCSFACLLGLICTLTLCPSPDVRLKPGLVLTKRDPLKMFNDPILVNIDS